MPGTTRRARADRRRRSCSGRRPPRRRAARRRSPRARAGSAATSSEPSATRQCCQKSPKPRLVQARRARSAQPVRHVGRGGRRDDGSPRSVATAETRLRSPPAHAPSPRTAHQRRPSAGAETRPTSTSPSRSSASSVAHTGHAAHVVPRPVDRVDDPARRGAVVAELLAEHALAGALARDELADRLLGGAVGLRDRRQVGLRLDDEVERAEARERDRVGGVGEAVREGEVGVAAHAHSRRRQSRRLRSLEPPSSLRLIPAPGAGKPPPPLRASVEPTAHDCDATASAASSASPAASTSASSPGRPTSWTDAGSPSSAGPHGQRERRPAEQVERVREADDPLAPRELVDVRGRRDEHQRRRQQQVDALERRDRQLLVLAPRRPGRLGLGVGDREAALDLRPRVLAVELAVLLEELAVHVGDLAHERRRRADRLGERERRAARETRWRPPRPARARVCPAAPSHVTPTETSPTSIGSTAKPGTSASISSTHPPTSRAIGPAWSKLGASGKTPSIGTSPNVGLKPAIPQHAAGIRIDPPESVPSPTSTSPAAIAAAVPPLEPPEVRPGRGRVRDRAVVGVLRGDAVGELVQVRLADVRVSGRLEPPHRLGRLRRHVVGEHGRAVRRPHARRVEEVLDREPDARRRARAP